MASKTNRYQSICRVCGNAADSVCLAGALPQGASHSSPLASKAMCGACRAQFVSLAAEATAKRRQMQKGGL